jgi:hypothetical protein
MALPSTAALIGVLRSTLETLENDDEFSPNDPAVKRLKSSLVRTLTEMEIRKATVELEESLAPSTDRLAA